MQTRRLVLAVVLLSPVLFFLDAFLAQRNVLPMATIYAREPWRSEYPDYPQDGPQQYDLVTQYYPWAHFFRQSILKGEVPLWNPYSYLGGPFFANPQSGILFPLTWLHLLFPLHTSFTVIFTLRLLLTLFGAYLFFKQEELSESASLAGALVYGFSMQTIVVLPLPYSYVTMLLPWALLSVSRLLGFFSIGRFLGTSAVIALIVLAGQPQSALLAFLAILLFALLRFRQKVRNLVMVGTAMTAAVLVTAVQWLPTLEYFRDSTVPSIPVVAQTGLPYSPWLLLTFAIRDFFGNPYSGVSWGFPGYAVTIFYSSVAAVLLAAVALAGSKRHPLVLFLVVLLVISVGLLCGFPIIDKLLSLPGLDLVKRNKLPFLADFSVAGLAALGVDRVSKSKDLEISRRFTRASILLFGVLAGAGLYTFREYLSALQVWKPTLTNVLLCLLVLIAAVAVMRFVPACYRGSGLCLILLLDLSISAYPLIPRGRDENVYPPLRLTSYLRGVRPRVTSLNGALPPATSIVYGLEDLRGGDGMPPHRLFRFCRLIDPGLGDIASALCKIDTTSISAQTLTGRAFHDAIEKYGPELRDYLKNGYCPEITLGRVTDPALFTLFNVEYIFDAPGRKPALPGLEKVQEGKGFVLFRNPAAKRVRLYSDWRTSDESEALAKLREVDLEKTVIVEGRVPVSASLSADKSEAVELTTLTNSSAVYRVTARRACILVDFSRFYQGWRAHIDGKDSEVFPADYLFKGVFVPAGVHQVTLTYRPRSVLYGAVLSVASLILIGLAAIRLRA